MLVSAEGNTQGPRLPGKVEASLLLRWPTLGKKRVLKGVGLGLRRARGDSGMPQLQELIAAKSEVVVGVGGLFWLHSVGASVEESFMFFFYETIVLSTQSFTCMFARVAQEVEQVEGLLGRIQGGLVEQCLCLAASLSRGRRKSKRGGGPESDQPLGGRCALSPGQVSQL